jgi:hypothetical protein
MRQNKIYPIYFSNTIHNPVTRDLCLAYIDNKDNIAKLSLNLIMKFQTIPYFENKIS